MYDFRDFSAQLLSKYYEKTYVTADEKKFAIADNYRVEINQRSLKFLCLRADQIVGERLLEISHENLTVQREAQIGIQSQAIRDLFKQN